MNQLGIFAKYWQAGRVKTRLAAGIGADNASRVYRQFIHVLLTRFGQGEAQRQNVLVFSPSDCQSQFEREIQTAGPGAIGNWQLQQQASGDLGQRMHNYFQTAFDAGCTNVVLIGSDSPNLPTDYVEQAFRQLHHAPVVLGPSDDGGYYLVGLRYSIPNIFGAEICWSSPDVWTQTIAQLKRDNVTYATLPNWYDIDELSDLRRLRLDLDGQAKAGTMDPASRELRRLIAEVSSPGSRQDRGCDGH